MSVEGNKGMIRRFYDEGANARNSAVITELLAPGFVGYYPDVMPGLGGETHGPEALIRDLAGIGAMAPDFRSIVEDLVGAGDQVCVRGRTEGTHTGAVPGVQPTGNRLLFTWTAIYRFEGGRIVERWMNDDAVSTFQQLGLLGQIPPPPAA